MVSNGILKPPPAPFPGIQSLTDRVAISHHLIEHYMAGNSHRMFTMVPCISTAWVQLCIFLEPFSGLFRMISDEPEECERMEWMNKWCFRPQFCICKAILGRGLPGLMRCYESCPWCRIDHLTYWPPVQRDTTEPQMPPRVNEWMF